MNRFKNKYRISSARLKGWNYSTQAFYYITFCCSNHNEYLGKICNGEMKLSNLGQIAEEQITAFKEKFEYINVESYVIMPNHVHILLFLHSKLIVSKHNKEVKASLAFALNWYKGICTFKMRKHYSLFGWQTRFYDSVVWDEEAYYNIRQYIQDNPARWQEDKYCPKPK